MLTGAPQKTGNTGAIKDKSSTKHKSEQKGASTKKSGASKSKYSIYKALEVAPTKRSRKQPKVPMSLEEAVKLKKYLNDRNILFQIKLQTYPMYII